jgi:hypothetical protein
MQGPGEATHYRGRVQVMTKAEITSLVEAAVANIQTFTSANSGACVANVVGRLRFNLEKDRMEVCSPGTITHFWRPVGSVPDCADVDSDGVCTQCYNGMALSRGTCLIPADIYHVDFDDSKVDLAAHAYSFPAFNGVDVRGPGQDGGVGGWASLTGGFVVVLGVRHLQASTGLASSGPWGQGKGVLLDGVDAYVDFPDQEVQLGCH